jgi:hypothetical protein
MMKLLTKIISFKTSLAEATLSKYLVPVTLNTTEANAIPILKLKPEKHLMKNWWSEKPFEIENSMAVPVFSF